MPENNILESPSEVSTGRRRDYIPSAHPGSRLPHMYVRVNKLSEVCINISVLYNYVKSLRNFVSSFKWVESCLP